jgi:hypothetical protein
MKVILKERPPYNLGLWYNKYSACVENGSIINYIRSIKSDKTIAIPYGDGLVEDNEKDNHLDYSGYDDDIILGVLCTQGKYTLKNKIVCLPLDDDIFQYGLKYVLEKDVPNIYLPWEYKKSIAYWRGACPLKLRIDVMTELYEFKYADALFVKTPWMPENHHELPYSKYYDQKWDGTPRPIPLSKFIEYKYLLVIDGYIIGSNFEWIFGSGSVPILISDPTNEFWFKHLLEPWVNYVPVDYSLNDLKTNIQYLVEHDDVAEKIAQNAKKFADKVFSSEFQKKYLEDILS